MYIWKRVTSPFLLKGEVNYNIKTKISNYKTVDIGLGINAVVIEKNGVTSVYELESGGLIGYSLEEVKKDIETCNDIDFIKNQIVNAKKMGREAKEVSNEEFFNTIVEGR